MHLLAKQLFALNRADLIPNELITQYPVAANYIAEHWGEAGLEAYLLKLLVLDDGDQQVHTQLANSPEVVLEVMRLSVAYIELLDQIADSADIWGAVPEVADIDNAGYVSVAKYEKDLSGNTYVGYLNGPQSVLPKQDEHEEWSALMQASFSGQLAKVRTLLATGQNLSACDVDGHQSLHLAAMQGHSDVVKTLLEVGADVNAQSYRGNTALILACAAGHLAIVKMLLGHGAKLHHMRRDGRSALHQAVVYGHDAVVACLLEAGANPLAKSLIGETALSLVPSEKNRMAQLLEAAIPRRKLEVLAEREIVFQPLIDWN